MKELPDTLHELLAVALHDLELCEQDDAYTVDMSEWHSPCRTKDTCFVCLAGAALAKTCGIDQDSYASPISIDLLTKGGIVAATPTGTAGKMRAINNLRLGRVAAATWDLYGAGYDRQFDRADYVMRRYFEEYRDVADYHGDRERFKEQMRYLQELLESQEL